MDVRRQQVLRAALVGDALGRPMNGLKQGHIQQLLGGPAEGFLGAQILFPDRPDRNAIPGTHSANAQRLMAAVATRAADDLGRSPVARVGAHLLELAGPDEGNGALRNPGRPLTRAIARWRVEFPWEEADYFAADEASEGVSAALCGIVGACIAPEADDVGISAVDLARLTHFSPLALASAEAVRFVLSEIFGADSPHKLGGETVAALLLGHLEVWEKELTKKHLREWKEIGWGAPRVTLGQLLSPLPSLLREASDDLAVKTIVATAGQSNPTHAVTHVQHGYVGAGLCWALYRGLGSLPAVRAVEDVLNRGGETAVVTSLVAALMVARHGADCLLDEYYAGTAGLAALDGMMATPPDGDSAESWLAGERRLSGEESTLHETLLQEIQRQRERDAAKGKLTKKKEKSAPVEEEPEFTPPPHLWLKPGEEEDPKKKRILREARGKRKIEWKEERREKRRDGGGE